MKITLNPGAYMPERAYEDDAGLDLRTPQSVTIPAYSFRVIDTGVHIQIPKGYYGAITSKSGLMSRGITCRGTIDTGYTGSIKAVMFNHSNIDYVFKSGDKVTQLIIQPYIAPQLELVGSLDETERGNKGFGSSGR